jgi:starvation-inducible DNA-binding protein
MEAHIGIKSENVKVVANTLIGILADEFILYVQTRKAHWNVESPHFFYLHKLFEEQYSKIGEVIDEVAERIRSIGHYAPATLREYLQLTHLTEKSNQPNDHKGFIGDLLTSHESIIMNLRRHIVSVDQDLHDAGTSDFITGVMAAHEKMAWILRSHLTD